MPSLRIAVFAALSILPAPALATQTGPVLDPSASATVALKQMSVVVDARAEPEVRGAKLAAFKAAAQGLRRCEDVAAVAKKVGAKVDTNPVVPLSALPEPLRATMLTLPVGRATPLFGEEKEGIVRVLVLCGRSG